MKSVLTPIQPYYVFLIIARLMGWDIPQEKTVEVRKDYPKDPAWNKVTHIYCSRNRKSFNRIPAKFQPLMERFLGKVIGEFVCDIIHEYESEFWDDDTYESIQEVFIDRDGEEDYRLIAECGEYNAVLERSCLTWEELRQYIGKDISRFYGWHISDLKIYDKPKELGEFKKAIDCEEGEYCLSCVNRFLFENGGCRLKALSRPPQSWRYVEV